MSSPLLYLKSLPSVEMNAASGVMPIAYGGARRSQKKQQQSRKQKQSRKQRQSQSQRQSRRQRQSQSRRQ